MEWTEVMSHAKYLSDEIEETQISFFTLTSALMLKFSLCVACTET